jgi:hypothetical protein
MTWRAGKGNPVRGQLMTLDRPIRLYELALSTSGLPTPQDDEPRDPVSMDSPRSSSWCVVTADDDVALTAINNTE